MSSIEYHDSYSTDPNSEIPMPETTATKPYDWTYTTAYAGHSSKRDFDGELKFKPGDPEDSAHAIPIAELTRPDPILFYAEVPLFEDELHDNGSSHLLVRIVSVFTKDRDLVANVCIAYHAWMLLHTLALYSPCRQRTFPDI